MRNRLHPIYDSVMKYLVPLFLGIVIFYDVKLLILDKKEISEISVIFIFIQIIVYIFGIYLLITVRAWYDAEYLHIRSIIKEDMIPLILIKDIKKSFLFNIYKISFKTNTSFGSFVLISCEERGFTDNNRIEKFKRFLAQKFPENEFFKNEIKNIDANITFMGIQIKKKKNSKFLP